MIKICGEVVGRQVGKEVHVSYVASLGLTNFVKLFDYKHLNSHRVT